MDFMVLRVPLPADVIPRANIIAELTPHIQKIEEIAGGGGKPKVERERKRRTPEERAAATKIPGQTDLEEAIAKARQSDPPLGYPATPIL